MWMIFFTATSSLAQASTFKNQLASVWEISDLGEAKFCLSIAIERDLVNQHIYLSQTALIDKILTLFNMTNCNPVSTPMEAGLSCHSDIELTCEEELELAGIPYHHLTGLLMYLAITTHPDIALAVQKLTQFMTFYHINYWNAAKCVLCYLSSIRKLQLCLGSTKPIGLLRFADASYACCPHSGKLISTYCFTLGGGIISWASHKQRQ
jgi:hypothetical protein